MTVAAATAQTSAEPCARVVVVDDDDVFRSMLTAVLQDAGHDVVGQATNGLAAVRLAEQLQPDVITMDLDLPRLSGVAATERIAAARIAPVIVVSGSQSDEDRIAALAAGARWFVPKLEAAARLPEIVDSLLESVRGFVDLDEELRRLRTRKAGTLVAHERDERDSGHGDAA